MRKGFELEVKIVLVCRALLVFLRLLHRIHGSNAFTISWLIHLMLTNGFFNFCIIWVLLSTHSILKPSMISLNQHDVFMLYTRFPSQKCVTRLPTFQMENSSFFLQGYINLHQFPVENSEMLRFFCTRPHLHTNSHWRKGVLCHLLTSVTPEINWKSSPNAKKCLARATRNCQPRPRKLIL